jgi:hypothetical protein
MMSGSGFDNDGALRSLPTLEHETLTLKTKINMENKTSINHKNENDANRLLAEVLISKLQERLKLFPDEDDAGLYDRGLYDGYLNSLKIVTEECAKHFR